MRKAGNHWGRAAVGQKNKSGPFLVLKRVILLTCFILASLLGTLNAHAEIVCEVGNLSQGRWVTVKSTTGGCYYSCTSPQSGIRWAMTTTNVVTPHEIIQGDRKFLIYTLIWNASPSCVTSHFHSGFSPNPEEDAKCWYFAQIGGFPPQFGNSYPTEGVGGAFELAWRWNDKYCDDAQTTPNPDTGKPECNDQGL